MYEPNIERVLALIRPGDVVLDIGGWACPFNRATHIMDAAPYESRGYYATVKCGPAYQGGEQEHFARATWIQRDICEKTPYPFADKSVDFVICSHTLEDIRDPLFVCAEMMRIGRRGYIEVPSREWETCRGNEHPKIVGLSHHRWLIEIRGSHLRFVPKYHMIHADYRYSLPARHLRELPPDRAVSWLFWDDTFTFEEAIQYGAAEQRGELLDYVARIRPYSPLRIGVNRARDAATTFTHRVADKMRRELRSVLSPAKRPSRGDSGLCRGGAPDASGNDD